MIHKFIDNKSDKTLVLFHGTGGDENVLLPIAKQVAPTMNHLSLRGEHVCFGKRRFSKVQNKDQVVDEEDLVSRVPHILNEIHKLKEQYQLKELWALGFSNGSMTLTAMMLNGDIPFKKVVLLRPLDCNEKYDSRDLSGIKVLIHSGKYDPLTPAISAIHLEHRLIKQGAFVQHRIYPLDHRMKMNEVRELRKWFDKELLD